jgi:hypothetical protein
MVRRTRRHQGACDGARACVEAPPASPKSALQLARVRLSERRIMKALIRSQRIQGRAISEYDRKHPIGVERFLSSGFQGRGTLAPGPAECR